MAIKRVHAIIHGKVQNVYYRMYAEAEGTRLGIAGWVRNRSDDTVEATMEGEAELVDAMVKWLHEGPPTATVTKVEISDERPVGETGKFNIRFH